MHAIIIHPEYHQLKAFYEALKADLLALQAQRDDLVFHFCRQIETEYVLQFGELEYNAWELFCESSRLAREIELIQAKLNREEPVNLREVQAQLDKEFTEYMAKLEEQREAMASALDYTQQPKLSEEEAADLKALYWELVKATHPDMNPGASPKLIQFFQNVVKAFEAADLGMMQMLKLLIDASASPKNAVLLTDELKTEIEILKASCQRLDEEITKVKASFPYNQLDLVSDPEAASAYKEELKRKIGEQQFLIASYQNKLKMIKEGTLWLIS